MLDKGVVCARKVSHPVQKPNSNSPTNVVSTMAMRRIYDARRHAARVRWEDEGMYRDVEL